MIIVIFYQLILISLVERRICMIYLVMLKRWIDVDSYLFWQVDRELMSVVQFQPREWQWRVKVSLGQHLISISLTSLASFSLLQYPSYKVTTDTVQLSRYPEYSLKSHWYLQLCSVLEMAPVTDNNTLHCTGLDKLLS